MSARGAAPGFDQALESAPQFRIFELRQLDRAARRACDGLEPRLLAPTEMPLDEAQIAHHVRAEPRLEPGEDFALQQVQLLNPHRGRHLDDRGMEFEAADFGAPRDRFAYRLGPYLREAHESEMTLGIELFDNRLERRRNRFRALAPPWFHRDAHLIRDAMRVSIRSVFK